MTTTPRILPDIPLPPFGGAGLEVRWTAVTPIGVKNGPRNHGGHGGTDRHVEFVISVEHDDDRHTYLRAWLETPLGVRQIMPRRPVGCVVTSDGELLHIDSRSGDRRVLALTVCDRSRCAAERSDEPPYRLLYAQSDLLAEAGLAPASCDPPTVRAVETDAISDQDAGAA